MNPGQELSSLNREPLPRGANGTRGFWNGSLASFTLRHSYSILITTGIVLQLQNTVIVISFSTIAVVCLFSPGATTTTGPTTA